MPLVAHHSLVCGNIRRGVAEITRLSWKEKTWRSGWWHHQLVFLWRSAPCAQVEPVNVGVKPCWQLWNRPFVTTLPPSACVTFWHQQKPSSGHAPPYYEGAWLQACFTCCDAFTYSGKQQKLNYTSSTGLKKIFLKAFLVSPNPVVDKYTVVFQVGKIIVQNKKNNVIPLLPALNGCSFPCFLWSPSRVVQCQRMR